jgi:hypothetical protein
VRFTSVLLNEISLLLCSEPPHVRRRHHRKPRNALTTETSNADTAVPALNLRLKLLPLQLLRLRLKVGFL